MAYSNTSTKQNPFKAIKNYFAGFGQALTNGDGLVKGSLALMGLGYIGRKQIIKGLLITSAEILFILLCIFYIAPVLNQLVVTPAERQAVTGIVETEGDAYYGQTTIGAKQYVINDDPFAALMGNADNSANNDDYDNSLLIIIKSMIGIFFIIAFAAFYIHNIKACYELQVRSEEGKYINKFKDDLKDVFNGKFHITLLTLPTIGVILMNVIPVMILIAIAFTNYTQLAMPPNSLLTWIGWKNFASLLSGNVNQYFSYAFGKVLGWTIVWAILGTLTCFIGGILLASLINSKNVVFPRMWRTLFIICIAVPQFVSLVLVRNFFADHGIVNTMLSNIGITDLFKDWGWISTNYIPFLTDKNWAKVMIILINIWVGVPYQMLIATGLLMNIPQGQVESARIDGASKFQIFRHIIMPYILVVEGPALITDFVRNINNFNVIYLLTQDVYTTTDLSMAGANAKEVDLLVTWLFRLTNEYYNYSMASVIGIFVFIICAAFTLISFSRMMKGGMEDNLR